MRSLVARIEKREQARRREEQRLRQMTDAELLAEWERTPEGAACQRLRAEAILRVLTEAQAIRSRPAEEWTSTDQEILQRATRLEELLQIARERQAQERIQS